MTQKKLNNIELQLSITEKKLNMTWCHKLQHIFLYNMKLIHHLVVHTITYFNIGHNSIANDTHDNRPSHKTIIVRMTATTTH